MRRRRRFTCSPRLPDRLDHVPASELLLVDVLDQGLRVLLRAHGLPLALPGVVHGDEPRAFALSLAKTSSDSLRSTEIRLMFATA